jgi:hypothetical protein
VGRPTVQRGLIVGRTSQLVVAGFAALWLAGPAFVPGLADPHESARADLARRVAVQLFGAALTRPGDPTGLPTLGDLGSGELPTVAMALSFRVFGYHDWAARLPALFFAVVAVLALHSALTFTSGSRAASVGSVSLLAMPLFFLHARSVGGEGIAMAGIALVVAGGVRVLLSRHVGLGTALLAVGLVVTVHTRGFGVAVAPLLALAVAGWYVGRPLGWVLAFVGLAFASLGVFVGGLERAGAQEQFRLVGLRLAPPGPRNRTFDQAARHLGHAAFPLSAFVPLALFVRARRLPGETEPEQFGRVLWVVGTVASTVSHLGLTNLAGPLPFFGAVFVAGLLGDFVASLGQRVSAVGAVLTVALVTLLGVDCARDPSRLFAALAWQPGGLSSATSTVAVVSAIGVLTGWATLAGAWDRDALLPTTLRAYWAERRGRMLQALRWLQTERDGRLFFGLALFEATLVGLAALFALGGRAGWAPIVGLPPRLGELAVAAWWGAPLVALAIWAGSTLMRDVMALARRWMGRSDLFALGVVVGGGWLGFVYFPEAQSVASPKPALIAFETLRGDRDALGIVGVSRTAVGLHSDVTPVVLDAPPAGLAFLARASEGTEERSFLLAGRELLPNLNHLWRAERSQNLPVVGLWDQFFLASASSPAAGPYDAWLGSEIPTMAHEADFVFDERIEVVGWQLESASGKLVESMLPGVPYTLKVALVVRGRLRDEWRIFTHVERGSERRAFDHAFREGAYPMRYWLAGDVLVDETTIVVPEELPVGDYTLFFGFFHGKERLPVSRGDAPGDRARLGRLRVL